MNRDLYRGIIRAAMILCLMVSCAENIYFMGELTKDPNITYSPYYKNKRHGKSYYNKTTLNNTKETNISYKENVINAWK